MHFFQESKRRSLTTSSSIRYFGNFLLQVLQRFPRFIVLYTCILIRAIASRLYICALIGMIYLFTTPADSKYWWQWMQVIEPQKTKRGGRFFFLLILQLSLKIRVILLQWKGEIERSGPCDVLTCDWDKAWWVDDVKSCRSIFRVFFFSV